MRSPRRDRDDGLVDVGTATLLRRRTVALIGVLQNLETHLQAALASLVFCLACVSLLLRAGLGSIMNGVIRVA